MTCDGKPAKADKAFTSITFDLKGAKNGDKLRKKVTVKVTDSEDLKATASLNAEIAVTAMGDDPIPPPKLGDKFD